MKTVLFAIGCVLLLSLPSQAGSSYNVCFYSMDMNGDDAVDRDEFAESFAQADMAVFESADGDGSGMLDHEEWESWKQSQGFEDHHG